MSNSNKFVSRFKDVNLYQKGFSTTSVKAVKEIYAEKSGILKHNVKFLDFSKCLTELRKLKEKESESQIYLSANGNMIGE